MRHDTLPLTHRSISPEGWLDLAENIENYRELKQPLPDSDLGVALEIARNMALVARKRGVQSYSEQDVFKATRQELEGPFNERNAPGFSREGIFAELASLPFIEVIEADGSRFLRLFV